MPKWKEIKFNGKTYPNLKQACNNLNLNYGTVIGRLKLGWSIEDAMSKPIETGNKITYNNITYPSLRHACLELCLPYKIIHQRIAALNWSLEKALSTPIGKGVDIVYKGITYKSVFEACKKLKISYSMVSGRIHKGWTVEDALSIPSQMNNNVCYGDMKYKNLRKACEMLNMPYSTVRSRVVNLGWDLEKALSVPIGNGNSLIYQGIKYESLRQACKELQVSYKTVHSRIKSGNWTIEEALTTEIKSNEVEYQGITYKSLRSFCEKLNFNYDMVYSRIRHGWLFEEAISCPLNLSLGEYRIKTILDKLGETYYHNKTVKAIFTELGLLEKYDSFIDELVVVFDKNGFHWTRKRITLLRYDFAVVRNGKMYLLIEFDGEQHFKFVHLFFKTLEKFLYRHNCDEIKDGLSKYCQIPLLRIRFDQINYCQDMIEDALENPHKYLTQHNTYLTNEEYWCIFEDVADEMLQDVD